MKDGKGRRRMGRNGKRRRTGTNPRTTVKRSAAYTPRMLARAIIAADHTLDAEVLDGRVGVWRRGSPVGDPVVALVRGRGGWDVYLAWGAEDSMPVASGLSGGVRPVASWIADLADGCLPR